MNNCSVIDYNHSRDYGFLVQVMPAVIKVMKEEASLVTLVKPQFEAGKSQVSKLSFHLLR